MRLQQRRWALHARAALEEQFHINLRSNKWADWNVVCEGTLGYRNRKLWHLGQTSDRAERGGNQCA
jgi:hypothetical protein